MSRKSISFSFANGEARVCRLTQGARWGSSFLEAWHCPAAPRCWLPFPLSASGSPALASSGSMTLPNVSSFLFKTEVELAHLPETAQGPDARSLQTATRLSSQHTELTLRLSALRGGASGNDLRMEIGTVSCPSFFI